MRNVYVSQTAVATSLGETLSDTWRKLINGKSAINTISHFKTGRLPYPVAACIDHLRQNKRTNHTRTLMQAVLDQLDAIPEETTIIWTGIKGNAEAIEGLSRPVQTSRSGKQTQTSGHHLPKQYLHWIVETLGFRRIERKNDLTVNAACASSTVGLALGAQKIALKETDHVLVCGADLVTRFVHTGFSSLKALTQTTCRPFDRNRDGLCLGDGAFAILLSSQNPIQDKTTSIPTISIAGWGIANDAVHITGPAEDGRGLVAAIQSTLDLAAVAPDQVEAFCAHGTGTVYNDAMELKAIDTLFGDRKFPVFSVKGAIGHTLGAAGGIETALSCHSLVYQTIPPTVGLKKAEDRAMGRVSKKCQSFEGNTILTTNSGFGGINAALVLRLKRAESIEKNPS